MKFQRQTHPEHSGAAPCLFLLPSLGCVAVFVLFPFLDAVRRSFFSAMSGQFVGLQNYKNVLENQAFRLAAGNTVRFTLVCIPFLVVLSLLMTLLIAAAEDRRGIFKTTFLLPMAIPVASLVLLWQVLFHKNGLVNQLTAVFGLPAIDWLQTGWAFVFLTVSYLWKNVGYDMVLWLSGMSSIPPSLYEAAQMDGANAWHRLLHVTLPNLSDTLFTVIVLSVLNSFKVFREAYLLMGERPDRSIYLLQHLFNNWFVTLDIDKMCAAAVLLAVTVFLLILLLQAVWGRRGERR